MIHRYVVTVMKYVVTGNDQAGNEQCFMKLGLLTKSPLENYPI